MRHLLRTPHNETPVVVVVRLTIGLRRRQPLWSRCHQTPALGHAHAGSGDTV
jgi:hypothetical protein